MTDSKVDTLKEIAREVCSVNEEEFNGMMSYYHDLGILIHHGDLVALRSQWLVGQFTKLIVIRHDDDQVLFVQRNYSRSC